jgi:hypothetical protein
MSLPRSVPEQTIRAATVARAREVWPGARVIHELNVEHGRTRADLAVVTSERLILIEIKSAADTLDRLDSQLRDFSSVAHEVIVAADAKWFVSPPPEKRNGYVVHPSSPVEKIVSGRNTLWRYDGGAIETKPHYGTIKIWPWHQRMLCLLWRSELETACHRLRVAVGKRPSRFPMIDCIMQVCKPPEIEAAVLDALRSRPFAVADEPQPSDVVRSASVLAQTCLQV